MVDTALASAMADFHSGRHSFLEDIVASIEASDSAIAGSAVAASEAVAALEATGVSETVVSEVAEDFAVVAASIEASEDNRRLGTV